MVSYEALIGAQFSRDDSHVLTWSWDGTVRLWDVTKPDAVQTFKHDMPVNGATFSYDESRVLTWSADNTVWLVSAMPSEVSSLRSKSGRSIGCGSDVVDRAAQPLTASAAMAVARKYKRLERPVAAYMEPVL